MKVLYRVVTLIVVVPIIARLFYSNRGEEGVIAMIRQFFPLSGTGVRAAMGKVYRSDREKAGDGKVVVMKPNRSVWKLSVATLKVLVNRHGIKHVGILPLHH
jgi:hypothetical protein